jgi:hypothetical protein
MEQEFAFVDYEKASTEQDIIIKIFLIDAYYGVRLRAER